MAIVIENRRLSENVVQIELEAPRIAKKHKPGQRTKKETPLDLLKKRYAKGEISKEEYEDIKKTLQK